MQQRQENSCKKDNGGFGFPKHRLASLQSAHNPFTNCVRKNNIALSLDNVRFDYNDGIFHYFGEQAILATQWVLIFKKPGSNPGDVIFTSIIPDFLSDCIIAKHLPL